MPSTLPVPVTERSFTTYSGLRLTAKAWGTEGRGQPILAIHGWLDNAGTWDLFLSDFLTRHPDEHYIICLDLAGHGFSDHRSLDSPYIMPSYLTDIHSVIETLGWTTFKLLGHSMGGVLCVLFAAAFPDLVSGVISVESFGPYAIPTQDVDDVEHYTAFKQVKRERNEKSKKTVFVGLAEAVNVRREGLHKLSVEAAWPLVVRGLMPVESTDSFTNTLMGRPTVPVAASRAATEVVMSTLDSLPPSLAFSITQPEQTTPKPWSWWGSVTPTAWTWSSDARVREPALMWYHEAAVESFLRRIACPVLVLWGETGLKEGFNFVNRAKIVKKGLVTAHMLPGGHHLHLEPRTLGACVDKLEEWLSGMSVVEVGEGVGVIQAKL